MSEGIVDISSRYQAEVAKYKKQILKDYANKPLIEALPVLWEVQEVVDKLAYYPEYHSDERQLGNHYRTHMITRLFQVYQPLTMSIELESKISRVIRQGYIARNLFNSNIAKGFRDDYGKINVEGNYKSGIFSSSACGFSLVGISGLGKTLSLQRILNMYPQVIAHSEYKNVALSAYQVVYVKLECPFDGSVKGLLIEFFSTIDRLIGTNYYQKMMKTRATTDMMLTVMNQIVRNCSVGLIIIDEIQNLSTAKSSGSEKMLNFFLNLINSVGVPVVLVGTPKAIRLITKDFRQVRRGVGIGGDMVCDRMKKDKEWELLVRTLWHYQWTKKETPLTEELVTLLYEETQGIPDLLNKLYAITQGYVISNGKEAITPNVIKKVAREHMKLIQPMIRALKTGNVREIAKYGDISMIDFDIENFISKTRPTINLDLIKNVREHGNIEKRGTDVINENNKIKRKNTENNGNEILNTLDIRFIGEQAKKECKDVYSVLKESSYIKSYEEDTVFAR